jgi:RNA polymerase sigma-70 factor (ECF subfamily)
VFPGAEATPTMDHPDAPLAPQALLQHAGFVRALARHLLRDEHAAEDLAQEAWARFLVARPDESNLRGWFRAVLRNLAVNRGRGEERRAQRERASARAEAVEPAVEEHVQAELLRAVVEAVLALDEPHRATILARFYQGLETAEIARRTGASAATVRSREHRALAKLRERLDRESGGRERWAVVLGRLVSLSAPATSAAIGGGVVLALAASAVVVLGGVLAWRAAGRSEAHREARGAAVAEPRSEPQPQNADRATRPPASSMREPVGEPRNEPGTQRAGATGATATTAEIRGRLVYPDGSPAGGVPITLEGWEASSERVRLHGVPEDWTDLAGASDAEGRFTLRFEPHPAFKFKLEAKAPGHARIRWHRSEIRSDETVDIGDIRLIRGGTLEGRVVDATGAPLAGAPVVVTASAPDNAYSGAFAPAWEHAICRRDTGAFRIDDLPPGRVQLEADSANTGSIAGPVVEIRANESVTADIVHRGPSPARSIALSVDTRPFHLLESSITASSVRLIAPDGTARSPSRSSSSEFFFDELGDGLHALEIDDPRFVRWSEAGLLAGSRARARLVPSAALELDVRTTEGEPIERYAVRVELLESRSSARLVELHDGKTPLAEGRVSVPPGELIVNALADGIGASARVTLEPGETRALELVLGGGTAITGLVVHPDGSLAPEISVTLIQPAEKDDSAASPFLPGRGSRAASIFRGELDSTATDARGAFRFDLATGGAFALRAARGDLLETSTEAFTVEEGTTRSDERLVLPHGGRIRAILDAPNAACLAGMKVWAAPAESRPHQRFDLGRKLACSVQPGVPVEIGPLPPGPVRVFALLPDTHQHGRTWSGSGISGGRELALLEVIDGETVEAQLVLDECPGDVTVEVRVNGVIGSGVSVTLLPVAQDDSTRFEGATGTDGRFGPVRAFGGEYEAYLSDRSAGWSLRHPRTFTCPAGSAALAILEVELASGALVCTDEHGLALAGQEVTVLRLAQDGNRTHVVTRTADATGRVELTLVPGEYALQLGPYDPRPPRPDVVPFTWTASGPLEERVRL